MCRVFCPFIRYNYIKERQNDPRITPSKQFLIFLAKNVKIKNMDIQYTILLVFLLNLVLGFFVWLKNKDKKINILSALVAFTLALWAFSMFFYVKPFVLNSEIWIKIVYLFVLLMTVTWTYFFKEFLDLKGSIAPYLVSLFAFVFILFLFFTDLWVKEVTQKPWGPETILGPVYPYVGIFIVLAMAWVVYFWIKKYRAVKGIKKMQLLYVFVGMFIFSFLATIFDIIIPLITGNSRFFWISPFFSLFFVGANVYAIAKYRLMDIKLVLKGFSIFVFIIGIITFIIYLFQLVYEQFVTGDHFLKTLFIILITILLYNPIKKKIFTLANKKFFFSYFDTGVLISNITEGLMGLLEREKIYECVYENLLKAFHFKAFGILSYNEEKNNYKLEYNKGFKVGKKKNFPSYPVLYKKLIRKNKPIIVEEAKEKFGEKKIKNLMENLTETGVSLVIPLNNKNRTVGLMVLGEKRNRDMYNENDLRVLKIISTQIATTIENARFYEETRDFNEKLEEATKDLREDNEKLRKSKEKLQNKNKELEETLEDFYTLRIGAEDKGLDKEQINKENKKIKKRLNKLGIDK